MMQNTNLECVLRQEQSVFVSQRDSAFLLYSPKSYQVSVLNADGKEIWDIFQDPSTIRDAIRRLLEKQEFTVLGLSRFVEFIYHLVDRGFLKSLDDTELPHSLNDDPPTSPEHAPLIGLYIHGTNRCNLRCIYCYNAEYRQVSSADDELNLDELKGLLDLAAEMSVQSIVFTGGEPLLREDCAEAAKYARSLGMNTSCLTNGMMLKDQADVIAAAFDQVVVSLDSWRPDEEERVRVGGIFERIAAGIRGLVKAGGTCVSIRPVITRYNVESLSEFPEYAARELGCTNFLPALCSPTTAEDLNLFAYLPELETFCRAKRLFYESLGKVRQLSPCLPKPEIKASTQCGAGTGLLSIAPNGDVFPCHLMHNAHMRAGNIRCQRLDAIWSESPVLADIRRKRGMRFRACEACPIIGLCSLNCPALHLAFAEREKEYTSIMCAYARADVEEQLWIEVDILTSTADRRLTKGER